MPSNEDTTKISQVSTDDFVCNRANLLWLMSHSSFYDFCRPFKQLEPLTKELIEFMKKHGMLKSDETVDLSKCTRCDAWVAAKAQARLLDGFAQIFLWLYDRGRIGDLRKVRDFAGAARRQTYRRIVLAYSGKATKKRERLAVVE